MQNMKLFLLLAFSSLMLLEAYCFTHETDRQALLEFKSQVSEGKKVVLSSWNNSSLLCNWKGVSCGSKHKRVTSLDLAGLQLGGVISPSIGNLSFLTRLNLSDNSFGGTIPQDIGNLFRLEILDLSVNHLGGGIPIPLFNCSRLEKLSLYSNPLGGGIPSELGSLTKLVELYLYHNDLKGTLLASLGNLTSLEKVSFDDNKLEGKIPEDIARLTSIDLLQLSNNNFSGNFPTPIYNLSSLVFLDIVSCGFSGGLRLDFGILLPNLEQIYLGNNSFGGVIPTTLVNILNLRELRMEKTNMTGSIPPSFGKVPNLQILTFWDNYLGGPSSGDLDFLGALTNCTQLQVLDVGLNRLGGNLPKSIANLSSNLTYLSLQGNFISGSIPHDIGNLKNLQALGLQYNLLTGSLPTSLGKLIGLGRLGVHSNRMSGEIPSSIGNITILESLSLFSNTFEGSIPAGVRGTISYASPEYGTGGQPSIHGDVYSFGVLLLEMFTGKRPTNELFGGSFNLHSYTKSALPQRVLEIADKSILHSGLRVGFPVAACLTMVMDVGLNCCEESPTNRLATSETAKELISIRERFFKTRRTTRR